MAPGTALSSSTDTGPTSAHLDATIALGIRHEARITGGYIFDGPVRDHRLGYGVPGLFADGFGETLTRRLTLSGSTKTPEEFDALLRTLATSRSATYEQEFDDWPRGTPEQQLERWRDIP